MRAKAESSILITPAPWRSRLRAAQAWCRDEPRSAAAAALVAVTLLSGLAPAATSATAGAASPGTDPAGAADQSAAAAQAGPAFYPLAPLPRPADGPIPIGKGMWVHKLDRVAHGSVQLLVDQAKAAGLTHVYIRLGSSKSGFYARQDLDRLLPVAHRAGLKVVGWDFPYLANPNADAERAREQIWYATPTGDRIDAFSADIETGAEGTQLTTSAVQAYGALVRAAVGPGYPLIATVPRPSPKRWFPFNALGDFDAIAPMVYWGNRDPATDVAGAIAALAQYNKPILPVGQAYDMAQDGAPRSAHGAPSKAAIERFIQSATANGAVGLSFWVWDTATADHWQAITEAGQLDLAGAARPDAAPAQTEYLQRVLNAVGHPVPVDGAPGQATTDAIANLQRRQGLPPTGALDEPTVKALVGPTH